MYFMSSSNPTTDPIPILDKWGILEIKTICPRTIYTAPEYTHDYYYQVQGTVKNHPKFADGEVIHTSSVREFYICKETNIPYKIITNNFTIYDLGKMDSAFDAYWEQFYTILDKEKKLISE